MGGPLIVSILEKHPESLAGVTRLILQPNIHAKVIREWAMDHGWAIYDEEILEEDDKIYEILVLQRAEMKLSEVETLVGPLLMKSKSEAFKKKWQREMENWTRVSLAIEKAERTEENEAKLLELKHLQQMVEGVLHS